MTFITSLFLNLLLLLIILIVFVYIRKKKRMQQSRNILAEQLDRSVYSDSEHFDDDPIFSQNLLDSPLTETNEISTFSPNVSIKKKEKSELLIILYIVAQDDSYLEGRQLLMLLEELGCKYGEFNIFHHYGFGDIKVDQAVFSIANIIEPGTFEPQEMSEILIPGLALFLRLPGPFGGRVGFELMLKNANQIVKTFDAYIEDETHTPLVQQKISAIRERIDNFEQRGASLSMVQRFS